MSEKNKAALKAAWDAAEANNGVAQPVGRIVVCDYCDEDWTDRSESGGVVFESKAICPVCAPAALRNIAKYQEERFIKARCATGQSFADFVRAYRGPNASVRITHRP